VIFGVSPGRSVQVSFNFGPQAPAFRAFCSGEPDADPQKGVLTPAPGKFLKN
jgi:hypothetical protein